MMKTKLRHDNYYPLIFGPESDAEITPPQSGHSDIRSYSDDYFWKILTESNMGVQIHRNGHLDVPCRAIPYESAFTLTDNEGRWFMDVEIDVPYDGWYRVPMHCVDGKEDVRDGYFNQCGWTVVRFTEHQVRTQPEACVELLKSIVSCLQGTSTELKNAVAPENRWTFKDAVAMERDLYREKYLEIQSFGCPGYLPSIQQRIAQKLITAVDTPHIIFDEESHTYADERNTSGTADYTSVTTLIEKFFPYFDEEAYIEKFMKESGKTREEVVRKMLEPSERGTEMHQQIEYFLKGKPHREDSKEFQLFLKFHNEQVLKRSLAFYDAEKIVTLPQYGIAGTVDALFRKPDGSFVMVDWKRSKHLIIDGYPKKYGVGRGISILSHLDNSSYYHYELQQSFYKYILENEYNMKISSMILCVLHPDYDQYYTIKLANYRVEEVREMIAAHIVIHNS
jgi:hypothetical protein